uniref:Transposase n=1 Tax=Panagrolaimus superbus TaxID=310955 RepID=A0A914Y500_9BILA
MNGKEQKNYECIFDEIKNYWNTNNIKPKFGKILSDYEGALQNALLNFDDPKKVWGCTFHYSQALLRFVSKCGLMQYYSVFEKKDYPEAWIPIRTWIRSIMALPLLPIEERNFIWEKILKNPPAAPPNTTDWPTTEVTSKFVNYVETTWLTKPYNTWCFFGGGRVKNTNRSESWNSVISKLSDQKPKLNVFIHDQQLLFSKAEKRIEALLKGEKARDQEKKYKALVDRITAYEEEYLKTLPTATTEQQRIAINLRHLRRVQYLLHDIRNKSGATLKSKKKAAVVARGEESALWNADLGVLPETSETEPGNLASEAEIDNGEEDSGNDEIDAFVTADFDAEDLVRELAETFEEIEKSFATVSDNEKDAGEAEAVIDLAFQEDTPKATVDISDNDIVVRP